MREAGILCSLCGSTSMVRPDPEGRWHCWYCTYKIEKQEAKHRIATSKSIVKRHYDCGGWCHGITIFGRDLFWFWLAAFLIQAAMLAFVPGYFSGSTLGACFLTLFPGCFVLLFSTEACGANESV